MTQDETKLKDTNHENDKTVNMYSIPNGVIRSLKEDISEIKTALLGNKYQRKGLIERVELLEYEINSLKKLKWLMLGGASVIASVTTVVIKLLS